MPGNTALFQTDPEEKDKNSDQNLTSRRQVVPIAPRASCVMLQSWQSATSENGNYGGNKYARSASMDSLESSGSNSSGGGSSTSNNCIIEPSVGEYIPTRTAGKAPPLASHNPLQFVKVQSPLYRKAEQQIKLTKDVKICREALKEGEEEWQSNLDNWKSRRRKVTEKVIQRAEEMRQIEAEEQLRQEQCLLQQRKIKKFSEIVERKSSRSYNLDLYFRQGDDSGLGGTPEPDDVIDSQSSILRSDTSEGMTSEAESIDSDTHKSDKVLEKEVPTIPHKPQIWIKRNRNVNSDSQSPSSNFLSEVAGNTLHYDNFSSTEPSDIEGHTCDSETISSEEDLCFVDNHKLETDIENTDERNDSISNIESPLAQKFHNSVKNSDDNSLLPLELGSEVYGTMKKCVKNSQIKACGGTHSFKICIKPGDNKGFGFSVKGGKDQGCTPYIENVLTDGPSYMIGLREGDEIVSLNGEFAASYNHSSLIFTIKQAVYMGVIDLEISRSLDDDHLRREINAKSSNKKSSFAEKLALFSAGINSSSDKTKPIQSSVKPNVKSESLVLRRRSAFEKEKTERSIYRRSSCFLEEPSQSHHDNVDKRLSVDFTLQTHVQKSGMGKKDPPPVPVKPKPKVKNIIKTKAINIYECDKSLAQKTISGANNSTEQSSLDCEVYSQSVSSNELLLSEDSHTTLNEELRPECNSQTEKEIKMQNVCKETQLPSKEIQPITDIFINTMSLELSNSVINSGCITISNFSNQIKNFDNPLPIGAEITVASSIDCSNVAQNSEIETSLRNECEDLNVKDYLLKSVETNSNLIYKVADNFSASCKTSIETSLYEPPSAETEEFLLLENEQNTQTLADTNLHNVSDVSKTVKDSFEGLRTSAYIEICNDPPTVFVPNVDQQDINVECESSNIESGDNKSDFAQSDYLHTVDNLSDHVSNMQINPSPLCLPLEKTDEEDVISASTTSSSETPDTETVIETLPTNLSPLPNDEESSKHLNCSDQPIKASDCMAAKVPENTIYHNFDTVQLNSGTSNQQVFDSEADNLAENSDNVFVDDDEEEEYCRELDESLDQITSLDVIDEIEHRLMQQLEHPNDSFEEINDGLTLQLESDIRKEWIYYPEEYLEEFTPRNLQPPSEPPPPPPVETETEKVMPMTRSNSTKRIKKELWRRRSDFLGLDSPEGIDVDSILLPPPGLEEILKLEREQNQWLEKRLSLAETEVADSLSALDCLDSKNVQIDYTSNLLEDEDDVSKLCLDIEEENVFEPGFESQHIPTLPSHAPEESIKNKESPQHKAKQKIQNLGAAPKAKIMDSNKWITEKVSPINQKSTEPVFRQASYNENYWVAQGVGRRRSFHSDISDQRHSMTHSNPHPDVTLRTWVDRKAEFQKERPRSAAWSSVSNKGNLYDSEFDRKLSLDDRDEITCDSSVLESEAHQCSCCGKGLCEGSAMGIEALRLYFHIECFRCSMCQMLLGNGLCGTDVQVKNNQLYCPNCFTVS